MSPRLKRVWRPRVNVIGIAMTVALMLLVGLVVRLSATNDENHIEEVMAGANGNSRIQFIVIREEGGGNCWGPQGAETQSRTMMVFFDAVGRETGTFKFPNNPRNTTSCSIGNVPVLLATQEFVNLPGAPTPDFIIPPLLNPLAGKVCFRNNPQNTLFARNDCLSYGAFTGSTAGDGNPGPPAAALPIMNAVSLRRPNSATSFGSTANANFLITTTPTPKNSNNATFTIPVASLRDQGETVFTTEIFGGNGRTCATCHVKDQNFGMTPANVQSRFATVATTFDPLFIGELKPSAFDAGFDFNLNTLDLTAAGVATGTPCTGDLRGIITTSNGGRAKVLTRVSGTRYLVQSGANPPLTGTVSDTQSCSATVSSLTVGDLAKPELSAVFGLEFPRLMRTSSDLSSFPQGRALILENVDGTGPPLTPHVFRKSPHLLNLSRTAPFGFSGDVPNLQAFLQGAINQHYPRTMARITGGANPDFRVPTLDEMRAAEAFMLAQEFPAGNDPNKFDLDRFATTSAQRSGRALFFGPVAKCSQCHGGPVLAATTVSIQGKAVGINAAFNTGVVNQPINLAAADNLPAEQGGAREFSVPQLFNVKNLGPLFHDASVPDVAGAVTFYASTPFNTSPAGVAIGGIALNAQEKDQITAFLEALAPRPYTLSTRVVRFGARELGTGPTAALGITITNTSAAPITFSPTPCAVTGTQSGDFIVTSCPLNTPLGTGEARTITVIFNPSELGARAGILEINAPDPSGVDLFGTGGALGPAPTVTAVTPNSGSTLGGTAITVTGTNFAVGATVAIGGVEAGSAVVVNETTITASTGAHAAGLVNVVVTNPDAQTATLTDAFTYNAPPVVTSIAPEQGSINGGTTVVITGSAFVAGTTVTIGGVAATSVVVVNATTITAVTAAHAAGPADVKVTTPSGLFDTLVSGFTFVVQAPLPAIAAISPTTGATVGGTPVTILGANFQPGATVSIGGVIATNVSFVSPTVITATTGARTTAGTVDVVVLNVDGGLATGVGRFTYQVRPSNDNFINRLPITGGGGLTATGSNLVATAETGEPNDDFPGSGTTPSVWWTWTAPCSFTVDSPNAFIDTAGSSFDTVLGVFTGSGFPLTLFASDDDNGGAETSKVPSAETSVSITAGTALQIRVRGRTPADTGSIVLHVTSPCAPSNAPMVSSITPTSGSSTGGTIVTIAGTNFATGATVQLGGVSASVLAVQATLITAITPSRPPGLVSVVVTNTDGQSGTLLNGFTVIGPPTLTAISPTSAVRATAPTVTLTGTNFVPGMTVNAGTGITVSNIVIGSPTSATATFTIAANAPLGARNITVTTLGGTSGPVVFTILLQAPTLTGIAPNVGAAGQAVNVTLTGTSFVTGSTVDAGAGITVSNVVVNLGSEASATATFTIAPSAALGARNVTVTNAAGTSNTATFSVVDPFPDLTVSSAHTGVFGAGFNENYVLTVSNLGTAVTTDTITVIDTLPASMTFVSGSGTGWTCSGSQSVTCTRTSPLAPSASTTINLVVAVAGSAPFGSVTNAVAVSTAGDLNPANNNGTDLTFIFPTPTPSFTFGSGPLAPGQQATMGVTIISTFPHDVTGTVTMSFASNAAIPLDDPAIQFASGGRQLTFVIPAGTVQARFGSNPAAGPTFFQTGTVAGTFTFSGTLQAGTAQKTFSPSGSPNLTIPKQAPSIQKVETNTQNGFAAVISLQSTLREVTQMSLTFNTSTKVNLSCGGVAGCSVSGSTITFDVKSLFDNWFTSDQTFGSLSTLRLPLTISGAVQGSVNVTFRNSMGASNTVTFSLQ